MPRRLTLFPLRYHHEGDSQPLPVDLKGGHQTLTNSTGEITRVDSSPKNSYPPRSLQRPRVTRSMGNAQDFLKTRFSLVERWGRTGLSLGERSGKNSQESLRDLRFGARESEREHLCSYK